MYRVGIIAQRVQSIGVLSQFAIRCYHGRNMAPIDLIFATTNRAKHAQLAFVIATMQAPIRLLSAEEQFGDQAHYQEVGNTASLIAENGALEVAKRTGVPIVTEDSTFHVDSMGHAPGVFAGAYLKEHGRKGILKALGDSSKRYARIVSSLAWATPYGDTSVWMQIVPGHIARREWITKGMPEWISPSPENPLGGGFNAIFIPRGDTRTFSEIPPREALLVGYREPNFCALIKFLRERAR